MLTTGLPALAAAEPMKCLSRLRCYCPDQARYRLGCNCAALCLNILSKCSLSCLLHRSPPNQSSTLPKWQIPHTLLRLSEAHAWTSARLSRKSSFRKIFFCWQAGGHELCASEPAGCNAGPASQQMRRCNRISGGRWKTLGSAAT